MKNRLVALFPLVALAACGPSRKEFEDAKAALLRTQADLEGARKDASRLSGELSSSNRAKDEAARRATESEGKAASLERELIAARDGLAAKEAALATAEQERGRVAEELGRAKSAADAGEKRLADASTRMKQLETALQTRESEVSRARADAEEARRKLDALLAQAPAPAPSASDALSRLAGAGTEEVPPYQVLPLTFQAKRGEKILWAWSIVEGPADLAADVLDFSICGPDRAKAHGVLAGVEKKGDEGTLEIPTDGRWTVVWSNRHPSATFAVRFDVSVKPGS
ncbi:MAG: hypothetical protein ACREIU_09435 [Planctomycetota bacterium]